MRYRKSLCVVMLLDILRAVHPELEDAFPARLWASQAPEQERLPGENPVVLYNWLQHLGYERG